MTSEFEVIEKLNAILNIQLPFGFSKNIRILYKDSNENNWHAENISYEFIEPQECPFYPGYFYIPGFSRYVLSRSGDLLIVKTGYKKKWQITLPLKKKNIKGGYYVSYGSSDYTGKRKGLSRHRSLCLVFKPPGIHPDLLMVNHKDGIPGADELDNLEWCTSSENTKHGYENNLYPNKLVPIDAWNWLTGEKLSFTAIQKCADHFNLTHGLIASRLMYSNGKKYPDGWRFKRKDEKWDHINKYIGQSEQHRSLIGRNIFTNQVIVFDSIAEAGRLTDNNGFIIRSHCVGKPVTPLRGWNYRFLDEFEGWPIYTDRHLEIFKQNPIYPSDGILVYDLDENKEMFFLNNVECAKHFGISPITTSKLARYTKTRGRRFQFRLFKIKDVTFGPLNE